MPSATYTPLANITLGSSAASVTFSSISQAYRDLVLVCAGTSASNSNWQLRLNSDTANYSTVYMLGAGSGSGSSGTDTLLLGGGIGTSLSQSTFQIMDYSATDKHKTVLNRTDKVDDATYAWANRWASTSAVTSVLVRCANGANFSTGSTFALYGIAS